LRAGLKAKDPWLGGAVLLLVAKSTYTVVLGTVTSLTLLVVLLAAVTRLEQRRLVAVRPLPALAAVTVLVVVLAQTVMVAASDYHTQKGHRELFLGRTETAQPYLKTASRLNPENSDAWLALAYASFQEQDLPAMDSHIKRTLSLKRSMDTCKKSAHMYFYSQIYSSAYPLYQFLHRAYPEHLTSITKLALIHAARREYPQALGLARRVLAKPPRTASASDARNRSIAQRLINDLPALARHGGEK